MKTTVKTLFVGGNIVAHNFAVADNVSFEFGASLGLGQLIQTEKVTLQTDATGIKSTGGLYTFERSAEINGLTWVSGVNLGFKYAFSSDVKAGISLNYQAYGNAGNEQITDKWYENISKPSDLNTSLLNGVFDKTQQANLNNKNFIGLQNFGISFNFSLSI